jgi:hypothetical protein
LREALQRDREQAWAAGKALQARIDESIQDIRLKKRKEAEKDRALVEVARELVLNPQKLEGRGQMSVSDVESAEGIDSLGLPEPPFPLWYEHIYEQVGRLDNKMTFRVQEYYLPWMQQASRYDIDLQSTSGCDAFIRIRAGRARELEIEFDEEDVWSEIDPDRVRVWLATAPYVLGRVIADQLSQEKERADWWETAVALAVALDPLLDGAALGLVISAYAEESENIFDQRSLIPQYATAGFRDADAGANAMWRLAEAALRAVAPEDPIWSWAASTTSIPTAGAVQLEGPNVAAEASHEGQVRGEFRKAGNVWTITWQGVSMKFGDMKGLRYIHRLLEASPKPVDAAELIGHAENGGGDAHNKTTMNELRRRLENLADLRRGAVEGGNQTVIEDCDNETQKIEEYLKSGTGPGGRIRPVTRSRPGDQTGQAIRRALEAIKKENRPLAEYLGRGIVDPSGGSPRYVLGDDEPGWILR